MKYLLDRVAQVFHRPPPALPRVVMVTDGGLAVARGGEVVASVRWADVRQILAYKYDLFGVDEICIGLLTAPDADSWFEISEDWPGFLGAVALIEKEFPTISQAWYSEVMTPPFVRKETVLWARQ